MFIFPSSILLPIACLFVPFLLAILTSVHLRLMASDDRFDIFTRSYVIATFNLLMYQKTSKDIEVQSEIHPQ
jgi:hypothetical protein